MELLISKLPYDKVKINWNKNPVPMDLFKSFITVDLEISRNHLGASTGWTRLFNTEHKLEIGGGIVGGINYLNDIQYGKNLHNPYNNFVTPFHLQGIITKDGLDFFKEYYKLDIAAQIINAKSDVSKFENALKNAKHKLDLWEQEAKEISS